MKIFLRENFSITWVLTELTRKCGVSIPVLSNELREALVQEALTYTYNLRPKEVGPAKVKQELSGVDHFPPSSPFYEIRDAWQALLHRKLAELPDGDEVFSTPLKFTELSLQHYEAGSIGITPHRDPKDCINLVCVFSLLGYCRFCLCDDRNKSNPVEFNAAPGNVIIMRAPGFRSCIEGPMHFVDNIQGPRISFGLRQSNKPKA